MKTTHTPDTLRAGSLAAIASYQGRPCLSLCQPTHRRHPDNQQDPIRFRHLVKALKTLLRQQHAADKVQALIKRFEALAQDRDFWNHPLDDVAVPGATGLFRAFLLQRQPIEGGELAMVTDCFHTKPLRQFLQPTGRYQVLALSLHKVQPFEGDRNALDGVALAPGMPQTMSAALGDERMPCLTGLAASFRH